MPAVNKLAGIAAIILASAGLSAGAGGISFEREVMAVLSKAGCNAGACHGNLNGKGGFKLSLRGENPDADFEALVKQKPGRRVNIEAPGRSLILRKPTLDATHEGGRRFGRNSVEFRILSGWIQAGAPADDSQSPRLVDLRVSPSETVIEAPGNRVSLTAEAEFSDGSRREVTRLATYEPFSFQATVEADGTVLRRQNGEVTIGVRYLNLQRPARIAFVPARNDFVWSDPSCGNYIDRHVFARLRELRSNPARLCDDATFIRRATLDLTGRLPTVAAARAFIADLDPNKRARLVDELLASPAFAELWALKWADLLRVEEKVLDTTGVKKFHGWIRDSFAQNKPLDRFAREILTARGSTYEIPPANYYRALREPDLRSEAVAQVFLGTRIGCARCHNHPYERWTQDDYYRFAALFDRLDYDIKDNQRTDKFDKHQFIGEQVVKLTDKATLKDPRNKAEPKPGLLFPEAPAVSGDRDRFEQLADWLTAPGNPLFARVQANRIWFQIFGRGIVDPPDDFRATNPPSIPGLLDALAADFSAQGCDVKRLVRTICTSRVYQLSSEPGEPDDAAGLSHATVRRLPAEPLFDAVCQFLDVPPPFESDGPARAVQLPGVSTPSRKRPLSAEEQFLRAFGKPRRLINSDLERTNESSINQVFAFTSGPTIAGFITRADNRLGKLAASSKPPREIVDELYWAALTRPPTEIESAVCSGRLAAAAAPDARRQFLEDLAWALINSKEFALSR